MDWWEMGPLKMCWEFGGRWGRQEQADSGRGDRRKESLRVGRGVLEASARGGWGGEVGSRLQTFKRKGRARKDEED